MFSVTTSAFKSLLYTAQVICGQRRLCSQPSLTTLGMKMFKHFNLSKYLKTTFAFLQPGQAARTLSCLLILLKQRWICSRSWLLVPYTMHFLPFPSNKTYIYTHTHTYIYTRTHIYRHVSFLPLVLCIFRTLFYFPSKCLTIHAINSLTTRKQ